MPHTDDSEDEDVKLGRREYDELQVVDTTNLLTKEELQELKRLAALSKTTRAVVAVLMAIVMCIGAPTVFSWIQDHVRW